jgi:hypothetical protein
MWRARHVRALLLPLADCYVWAQTANMLGVRQVMTLLWILFAWSASAQRATVVVGTTVEGAALAFVHLVDVGSGSQCVAGTTGESSDWPLLTWSARDQPATAVAGTTGAGAALACVRLVGVGSARHCGSWHDK